LFRCHSIVSRSLPKSASLLPFALAILPVVGCASGEVDSYEELVGEDGAAIVGGTLDTINTPVVAVIGEIDGNTTQCSGTIVQVAGGEGYVLGSAHCGEPQYVIEALDLEYCEGGGGSCTIHPVVDSAVHPLWTGGYEYDFRMMRFSGAGPTTPVATLVGASDTLTVGQAIEVSGFGVKNLRGNLVSNTHRRHAFNTIDDLFALNIVIEQSYTAGFGGVCSGDSGGPLFVGGRQKLVVGVTALGDVNCDAFGVFGRVSAVYSGFIAPYLSN
jgi:hypothetical protein